MADSFPHTFTGFWARQILTEHENICWQYQVELVPPVIEISDNTSRIGSWQRDTRTIKISSALIAAHPWDTTVNVLKHEIAHQICSEIFKDDQIHHDRQFHKACDMIGLSKEFRSSSSSPETFSIDIQVSIRNSTSRKIISKVHKLLALAGSVNSYEASLAMQKANNAIRKYNLNLLESEECRNYTYSVINLHKKQVKTYQRHICAILTNFFFVQIINSTTYDPLKNNTFRTIEILGTPENVAIAEHCYHFLENRLQELWKKEKHRFAANTRTEKNSFYLGMLKGFADKLDINKNILEVSPAKLKRQDNVNALVTIKDEKLNEYVCTRFPRLKSISGGGTRIYKNTYNEGVNTGKKINLHKPLSSHDGYHGKLISQS